MQKVLKVGVSWHNNDNYKLRTTSNLVFTTNYYATACHYKPTARYSDSIYVFTQLYYWLALPNTNLY